MDNAACAGDRQVSHACQLTRAGCNNNRMIRRIIACICGRRSEAMDNTACAGEVEAFEAWRAHREEWAGEIHMHCSTRAKVLLCTTFSRKNEIHMYIRIRQCRCDLSGFCQRVDLKPQWRALTVALAYAATERDAIFSICLMWCVQEPDQETSFACQHVILQLRDCFNCNV